MNPESWNDRHEELLTRSAPPVADPSPAALARVWDRVADSMSPAPRRRARGRAVVAAGVVVLLAGGVGVGAAVATGLLGARTGHGPVDAEDLLLGGPGENLDPGAPDFGAVVEEETRDIPFPDAATRRIALSDQVPDPPLTGTADGPDGYGYTRTGLVRADAATAAICAWTNRWAEATTSGDAVARDEAEAQIRAAADWPAVRALVLSQDDPVEGRYVYLAPLSRAVSAGDRSGAAAALRESYCPEGLLPAFPQGDPMRWEERRP